MIEIIGLKNIPIIRQGDDIVEIILNSLTQMKIQIQDSDIFIIAHTIISRIEGRMRDLDSIVPTDEAIEIGKQTSKDSRLVSLILEESKQVLKAAIIEGIGKIIVETKLGFICADAGIDHSNTPGNNLVTLLPENPDKSAVNIRENIFQKTKKDVAIIISDTHGRPFRRGAINIALGVAGIMEIYDYRGKTDLFGYELQKTQVAIADELASAAELIMGEAGEGIPIILIRGYDYENRDGKGLRLIRKPEHDLFR